tara:strand:- start:11924 stop:12142 length:219 start_codon:yes stop_codon:yes gene_type:complete
MNEHEILKNIPKKTAVAKQIKNRMVSGQVTEVEHEYLRRYCYKHDITMSALVREVMRYFLTNMEKKENGNNK